MWSATGQFDGAAVPTNTMSKTDCALGEFMFYILPDHMFYIIYGWCFWAAQHIGVLIATAERWKMIATAVPSLCGCSAKKIVASDLIQRSGLE